MSVLFYIGLHQPSHAGAFPRACISINRLRRRRTPVACADVIVDSGAFMELARFGEYRCSPQQYAADLMRLHNDGVVKIAAAVSQDYMCEPFMLAKTGLTVAEHQQMTIDRYDAIVACGLPFPVMPTLQGYEPQDYVRHIEAYGARLGPGMWVGVGSVCKRNGSPEAVLRVLQVVHEARPDLRLHGFGVKATSLLHGGVRSLLYSADSMAWSFAARRQGRDGNAVGEAKDFFGRIEGIAAKAAGWWQPSLLFEHG
jgi:hypothetical protein